MVAWPTGQLVSEDHLAPTRITREGSVDIRINRSKDRDGLYSLADGQVQRATVIADDKIHPTQQAHELA